MWYFAHRKKVVSPLCMGGKHSMSNRKEGRKWRENTNQKATMRKTASKSVRNFACDIDKNNLEDIVNFLV
jgi:hypothetical protein